MARVLLFLRDLQERDRPELVSGQAVHAVAVVAQEAE